MNSTLHTILILVVVIWIAACGPAGEAQKPSTPDAVKPTATPSRNVTTADIAKLKWIEGTWRGMDGDKPFFERYKIEENAMIVEGLKEDGSPEDEPGRFELKNGEFGKGDGDKRSAASEIAEDYIQFVPAVPGKGNNFRFEKQSDGTWIAILEWPANGDKPARQKLYMMERWQPKK